MFKRHDQSLVASVVEAQQEECKKRTEGGKRKNPITNIGISCRRAKMATAGDQVARIDSRREGFREKEGITIPAGSGAKGKATTVEGGTVEARDAARRRID